MNMVDVHFHDLSWLLQVDQVLTSRSKFYWPKITKGYKCIPFESCQVPTHNAKFQSRAMFRELAKCKDQKLQIPWFDVPKTSKKDSRPMSNRFLRLHAVLDDQQPDSLIAIVEARTRSSWHLLMGSCLPGCARRDIKKNRITIYEYGKYDKYDSNMEVSKKMGVPPKSSELGAHLNLVLPSLNGDPF